MDVSLKNEHFPLVNYSFSDDDDSFEQSSDDILNKTIESLMSLITAGQNPSIEHLKCKRLQQGYIQKRVHMTLETEKVQEEGRKTKLLREAVRKTDKYHQSPLKTVIRDTDIFRRFSPRRVTFIRKKRMCPPVDQVKSTQSTNTRPKRKTALPLILLKQGLCFNARD